MVVTLAGLLAAEMAALLVDQLVDMMVLRLDAGKVEQMVVLMDGAMA